MSTNTGDYTEDDIKYGRLEHTPVDPIPGYTEQEAINQLVSAESRVELDLNGGQPIENPGNAVDTAAETLATYYMARPLVAPASQRGGDLEDSGGRRETFAEQYLTEYEHIVDQIQATDTDDDGTPDDERGERKFYTTHRRGEYADDEPEWQQDV